MWHYRDLLFFLVGRDIKIRYRQTVLGILWAVLQPLAGMVIFTIFFNKMAGIESGGEAPYPLFAYAGLVAWTFFSNAVMTSSTSLLGSQNLISKIYFPRPFIPIASIGAFLLDLLLSLVLVAGLFLWYQWPVSTHILLLPLFMIGSILAAVGLGLALSALSVRYRDVKYVVPFVVQLGLFVTPVIYPAKLVERFPILHDLLWLNPMAGMIEGFRYSLLGDPANWRMIGLSFLVSVVLFVGGLLMFRRWERDFADII
jgi:lipopolysaccharide transport system permease protein